MLFLFVEMKKIARRQFTFAVVGLFRNFPVSRGEGRSGPV